MLVEIPVIESPTVSDPVPVSVKCDAGHDHQSVLFLIKAGAERRIRLGNIHCAGYEMVKIPEFVETHDLRSFRECRSKGMCAF